MSIEQQLRLYENLDTLAGALPAGSRENLYRVMRYPAIRTAGTQESRGQTRARVALRQALPALWRELYDATYLMMSTADGDDALSRWRRASTGQS